MQVKINNANVRQRNNHKCFISATKPEESRSN